MFLCWKCAWPYEEYGSTYETGRSLGTKRKGKMEPSIDVDALRNMGKGKTEMIFWAFDYAYFVDWNVLFRNMPVQSDNDILEVLWNMVQNNPRHKAWNEAYLKLKQTGSLMYQQWLLSDLWLHGPLHDMTSSTSVVI